MGIHVGIYDHLGWAVSITASGDHDVVDRRRIDLIEPGVPNMPIHHPGRGRWRDKIEALGTGARASAERATAASLDTLTAMLPDPVTSVHLHALPADFPTDTAIQLRPPYAARADANMYRQVLAAVARTRGWAVPVALPTDLSGASLARTESCWVPRCPRWKCYRNELTPQSI